MLKKKKKRCETSRELRKDELIWDRLKESKSISTLECICLSCHSEFIISQSPNVSPFIGSSWATDVLIAWVEYYCEAAAGGGMSRLLWDHGVRWGVMVALQKDKKSNKTDEWRQDTWRQRPVPASFSFRCSSHKHSAPVTQPPHHHHHTNTYPPIPSLEDRTLLIEHLSVYTSTLPIGFWINGIIFLIKWGWSRGRWSGKGREAEDRDSEKVDEGCSDKATV